MKKCAIINDLSGFGKCSLAVALPIISVMGVEAHAVPTAVLTNQTGYDSFSSRSLSDFMAEYITQWKKLDVHFDTIITGFFNDIAQLENAIAFIDCFKADDTLLIVDPILADNGRLYDGVTDDMCIKMKELCFRADIITPNLSELAVLAGEAYSEKLEDITAYGNKLINKGIKKLVATGYKSQGNISNVVFENGEATLATARETGGYYSGTGDILSSIVAASVTNGKSLFDSVNIATKFIEKVIADTDVKNHNDGIAFEKYLGELANEK